MIQTVEKSIPNWEVLMVDWAQSGIPQKEFCRMRGVSYFTFAKERIRRRKRGDKLPSPPPGPKAKSQPAVLSKFVPVEVESSAPPAKAEPEIVIELPLGVVIRFRGVQAS